MKPRLLISSAILLASITASPALEPSPVLVKDIVGGSGSSIPDFSWPLAVGNSVIFAANDGTSGYEYWRTDGSGAGTSLLKDIYPGSKDGASDAGRPMLAGSLLYFMPKDSSGRYLWKSDGTTAGTAKVASLPSYGAQLLSGVGDILYYSNSSSAAGYELWRTDGTTAGTGMVADINPGTANSGIKAGVAIGNIYYFTATDGVHGQEIWRTDGTAAGTTMVKDICPPEITTAPSSLTAVGNTLYFQANDGVHGSELWRSDGTAAGTMLVRNFAPGTVHGGYGALCGAGGLLYFYAKVDSVQALWRSDGTDAGTFPVLTLASSLSSTSMKAWGNSLVFSPDIPGDNLSTFWKSDGTVAGTLPFKAGITTYPELIFGAAGGGFYFCTKRGGALWQSDGTAAGTYAVGDLSAGGTMSSYLEPVMLGGKILLSARDSTYGEEMRAFDTAPPSISKAEISGATKTGAKIKVAVNPNGSATSATLRFGPKGTYTNTINLAMTPANGDTLFHSFESNFGDLLPGTLYTYEVTATSAKGTRVSTGSFSTLSIREDWRLAKFGSTANAGDGADDADPDRDGLKNLIEYAFGLDPKAADAGKMPQAYIRKGYIKIEFTQPPGINDVTYGAEWSLTLNAGSWTAISDSGSGELHSFWVDRNYDPKAFMRLKVTPK